MRRIVLYISIFTMLSVSGYLAWRTYSFNQRSTTFRAQALSSTPIDGKFSLIDHNGKNVSQNDFKGKYTLVFFGYTYCPDVCPTTLQDVGLIMDDLGDLAKQVVPLFITIDPARDNVEVMKDFVENFHPSVVGLTGDEKQTSAAAKSFRAYFAKVIPDKDAPEDYHMSHTARLFVMGPDTKPVTFFQYGETAKNMTRKIRELLSVS
jgi:cytochrome oxidase Cu insertion factor (SCO1/SenC/PrrC family)